MKQVIISLFILSMLSACSLLPFSDETYLKLEAAEDAVLDDVRRDIGTSISRTPKPVMK